MELEISDSDIWGGLKLNVDISLEHFKVLSCSGFNLEDLTVTKHGSQTQEQEGNRTVMALA